MRTSIPATVASSAGTATSTRGASGRLGLSVLCSNRIGRCSVGGRMQKERRPKPPAEPLAPSNTCPPPCSVTHGPVPSYLPAQ
ncbi:hypothetical protein E2562_023870 [Oryza meyeriana var. granulata]|uniref:Uncharacterized protein n=1 Tax=Oryza meyeriana var. granulata TaxID=110450 RepID=A0A6G1D793_9ORYZ|nr:hypothetical protein E2562_023870 [Oryza meyeriana var. granulata]